MLPSFQTAAGRPKSRAQAQFLALLNARRSLRLAYEQSRRPQVRAATATAIASLDAAIDGVEGGTAAGKRDGCRLLQLDLDVMRLRHPPVRSS